MTANDLDLLGQFAREQSQDAFTTLVNRHLNLVYSAALRQVRSPQLAEEVSQSVFANLALNAAKLKPDTILTAWLYQVTRHTAIDVVRREARRQAREQIAFQMSEINDTAVEWTHIEPLLDEAMQSLDESDRTAILLRYFENKSLREVGEALGANEDAAQKRVSRAVERLRESFSKHKITVGASGLAALVSANAVQAAPAGLAIAVATGAAVASATISSSVAVTLTETIAMTTIQKTIVATVAAAAIVTASLGLYQAHVITNLRELVQTSKHQQEQQVNLRNQVQELQRELDHATNALASLVAKDAGVKKNPNEVLKLRGEVGRLRKENTEIGSTSAISKVTANPESRKMLRDQQKMGMGMVYKGLADRIKLTPEQSEKFKDLLADHIMSDVDHVTTILRDKSTPEQMDEIFASQDAVLLEKVEALLGQEGAMQYKDYTKNLLSTLTALQFKNQMTGTDAEKEEKVSQLRQVMEREVQAALAEAGLPADYQTVPMLNFRNIASQEAGDQSLKLLEDIYQRAAREVPFLKPEDLAKFKEFGIAAINNNRTAITLNRTMMAPISQ